MRKEIDINSWDRKEHFEFYSKIATPHYCVAFNIDVTNLLAFTRKNKISFYYSLIYLCTQAINEIDEFLLETEDNKVYKTDRRVPCFTDLKNGATSFHMVSLPCDGSIILQQMPVRKVRIILCQFILSVDYVNRRLSIPAYLGLILQCVQMNVITPTRS